MFIASSEVADQIGMWIGVYGAALATILGVRELAKNRRRVKVGCFFCGMLRDGVQVPALAVTAVNIGHRSISIMRAGLISNTGGLRRYNTTGVPKLLGDGEQLHVLIDVAHVQRDINECTIKRFPFAVVEDAEGKLHRCSMPEDHMEKLLGTKPAFFGQQL